MKDLLTFGKAYHFMLTLNHADSEIELVQVFSVDEIGVEIEDPFGTDAADINMNSACLANRLRTPCGNVDCCC